MSTTAVGLIGLVLVFVIILLRVPIGISFAAMGFLGMALLRGWKPAFATLGIAPYDALNSYSWTVLPVFVLMGYIAVHSGLASDFYKGIRCWLGHFRGGLAVTIIAGCTAFGACTGAAVGTAIIFTEMSLPEMRKYKYADSLTLGSVAGGSGLSALIPPSLPFIVYGGITQTPVGDLFIAGILPGILLSIMFIITISIMCRINPKLGPASPKATWKERLVDTPGMWAFIVVFVAIIGGIYGGIYTPTEAGSAGALVILIIALARRRLNWQGMKLIFKETGLAVCIVGILLAGAFIFKAFMVSAAIPTTISNIMMGATSSPTVTMFIIILIFIILGMFLDGVIITLITIPIFFPLVTSLGFDPIHFGVIFTGVILIGGLTPPFGITVYAMSGVVPDVPMFSIFRGVMPFLATQLVFLTLIVFFPQISLFLPSLM